MWEDEKVSEGKLLTIFFFQFFFIFFWWEKRGKNWILSLKRKFINCTLFNGRGKCWHIQFFNFWCSALLHDMASKNETPTRKTFQIKISCKLTMLRTTFFFFHFLKLEQIVYSVWRGGEGRKKTFLQKRISWKHIQGLVGSLRKIIDVTELVFWQMFNWKWF